MNVNKIDCQERIQQNHGLVSDYNFEYGGPSSQPFGVQQQPWNMAVWVQQPTMDQGGSQFQHLGSAKSTTTSMMSRFESPASAFYATERCMGFPQYDCQEGYPPLSSQITRNSTACESQFPSGQSSEDNCYTDSPDQDEPNFDQFRTSLQPPIAKPQVSGFQSNRPSEKSNHIIPCSNMQGTKLFQQEQHKLIEDSTLSVTRKFPLRLIENQDHSVCIFFFYKICFYLRNFLHVSVINLVLIWGSTIVLNRAIPIHSILHLLSLASPALIKRGNLQDFPLEMVVSLLLTLLRVDQ